MTYPKRLAASVERIVQGFGASSETMRSSIRGPGSPVEYLVFIEMGSRSAIVRTANFPIHDPRMRRVGRNDRWDESALLADVGDTDAWRAATHTSAVDTIEVIGKWCGSSRNLMDAVLSEHADGSQRAKLVLVTKAERRVFVLATLVAEHSAAALAGRDLPKALSAGHARYGITPQDLRNAVVANIAESIEGHEVDQLSVPMRSFVSHEHPRAVVSRLAPVAQAEGWSQEQARVAVWNALAAFPSDFRIRQASYMREMLWRVVALRDGGAPAVRHTLEPSMVVPALLSGFTWTSRAQFASVVAAIIPGQAWLAVSDAQEVAGDGDVPLPAMVLEPYRTETELMDEIEAMKASDPEGGIHLALREWASIRDA